MSLSLIMLLLLTGIAAGIVAALLGIGGGILMVPALTLVFGVPLRNALGASLVAAIATSDAAALWPGKRRLMEVSLAWQLALASTFGATLGATLALTISPAIVQGLFALVLLYTALQLVVAPPEPPGAPTVAAAPAGWLRRGVMYLIGFLAGASSGLLGIGGGIVVVPALYLILHKPFKVSTATSNLLVGLTALTGAFPYWSRGFLLAIPTLPLAAGAFVGAVLGSLLERRLSSRVLRWGMAALLTYAAVQLGSAAVGPLLAHGEVAP